MILKLDFFYKLVFFIGPNWFKTVRMLDQQYHPPVCEAVHVVHVVLEPNPDFGVSSEVLTPKLH